MKRPSLSLFTLTPWAFAACGFLTVLGNMLGLAGTQTAVFPPVGNVGALFFTSVLLVALGLLPILLRTVLEQSK
ncbi:MAG: hypothetical protein ACLFR7_01225 [Opitutales bacterium]